MGNAIVIVLHLYKQVNQYSRKLAHEERMYNRYSVYSGTLEGETKKTWKQQGPWENAIKNAPRHPDVRQIPNTRNHWNRRLQVLHLRSKQPGAARTLPGLAPPLCSTIPAQQKDRRTGNDGSPKVTPWSRFDGRTSQDHDKTRTPQSRTRSPPPHYKNTCG